MFFFMNVMHSFMNYAIFRELCHRIRFEVDCAKSHHHAISEGLFILAKRTKMKISPKDKKVANAIALFSAK